MSIQVIPSFKDVARASLTSAYEGIKSVCIAANSRAIAVEKKTSEFAQAYFEVYKNANMTEGLMGLSEKTRDRFLMFKMAVDISRDLLILSALFCATVLSLSE